MDKKQIQKTADVLCETHSLKELRELIGILSRFYVMSMPDDVLQMSKDDAIANLWHLVKIHFDMLNNARFADQIITDKVKAIQLGIKALELSDFENKDQEAADDTF